MSFVGDVFGAGGVAALVGKVLDKIFPDPIEREKAQVRLAELAATGELEELKAAVAVQQAQIEVNKIDAASEDKYQSRWRPTVGWVCTFGLAYAVFRDLMDWVAMVVGYTGQFPELDTGTMVSLLVALLGVGTWRTMDKKAAVKYGGSQ